MKRLMQLVHVVGSPGSIKAVAVGYMAVGACEIAEELSHSLTKPGRQSAGTKARQYG